jgi:hypothetical protein
VIVIEEHALVRTSLSVRAANGIFGEARGVGKAEEAGGSPEVGGRTKDGLGSKGCGREEAAESKREEQEVAVEVMMGVSRGAQLGKVELDKVELEERCEAKGDVEHVLDTLVVAQQQVLSPPTPSQPYAHAHSFNHSLSLSLPLSRIYTQRYHGSGRIWRFLCDGWPRSGRYGVWSLLSCFAFAPVCVWPKGLAACRSHALYSPAPRLCVGCNQSFASNQSR